MMAKLYAGKCLGAALHWPICMQTLTGELARDALDAAPDALIIVDGSGIVRFANRQASGLFGYSHDELVGQPLEQLVPERFRTGHVGHREDYFSTPRLRPMGAGMALFARRRDGGEFPVEISLSPVAADRALVAAAIRDVSERQRFEAELMAAREAADTARAAADRANQAKSRFLATASHDLRQPLQSLALLTGALRRTVTGADAAEVLVQQEHAVGTMARLLSTLLDLSKLESGGVKAEPRDFRAARVLETIAPQFAALARSKSLDLVVEPSEESIHSDPAMVEQVLKNLVSNALKYTRQGSVVVYCRRESGLLRIEVRDTGIGIPASQLAYIYDEFYQVGVPGHSARDGYGLGLSIVQRLVKLLNARLDVTSEVGKGSVFALLVPLAHSTARESKPDEARVEPAPSASRQKRVLLVEDDASVRAATSMLLRVEGYRVTAVASLAEAVRAAAQEAPELLVTDYHLAGGELGTEVITAVRGRVRSDLQAILLTGDTAVIKQVRSDPNLRILGKPVEAEELLRLLHGLLGE
jgi:PAS domain S-box-containing protein